MQRRELGLSVEKLKMVAVEKPLNRRETGIKGRRRGRNDRDRTKYQMVRS